MTETPFLWSRGVTLLDPDCMAQQRAELFPAIVSGLNSLFSGLLPCAKRVCFMAGTRGHSEKQALDTALVGNCEFI